MQDTLDTTREMQDALDTTREMQDALDTTREMQDALDTTREMQDALGITREVSKLILKLPPHDATVQQLKKEVQSGHTLEFVFCVRPGGPSVRPG